MNTVRNNERPINTELGGIDWVCMAFLRKLNTITILVKEVTITRKDGAIDRIVIIRIT